MSDFDLLEKIQESFDDAVSWANSRDDEVSNQLKSAMFVNKIGVKLWQDDKTLSLNVIKVPEKAANTKESGEWLLDITITQNIDGFKKKIVWAVESESDCSKKAFNDDFAKLFHINSVHCLYLNGLNHKTEDGKNRYIENRLKEVKCIIGDCNKTFWFAFWAAPCKCEEFFSIWNELDGKFKHLRNIRLFKFEQGICKEIKQ